MCASVTDSALFVFQPEGDEMASKLNELKQAKLDHDAAREKLKAEARKIPVAAKDRTAEQTARLDAIDAELTTLTEEAAVITADLARAERYQAEELAAAARLQVGIDHATERPVTFGEFLQGVAYAAMPGHSHLIPAHVKAELFAASGASSGNSADGGFLVRNEWNTSLLNKAQEASQLLGKCDVFPIGEGNDGIEAPYIDETSRATGSRWGGVQVYRSAEAATVTASKPAFGKFELRLEDMMGIGYASERSLRDATLLQSIFEKGFASEFAFKFDDEVLRGTGAGQNLGIFNAACTVSQAKETAQTNDTVKAENVLKMYTRMLPRNVGKAEWYVNLEVLPQLWTMSVAVGTAGGQLVYMQPNGLSSAPYGTLLGRPVNVLEQCSGLGDVGDIIFADFSEYAVISKAMTSADSMHVRFLYNERAFRWVYPIIGKPKLASAITPYKATAATTLSPFVTLAAR
jgi:HK97 family phage major capsid protein